MIGRFVHAGTFVAIFAMLGAPVSKADTAAPSAGYYSFNIANGHISGSQACKEYSPFFFTDGGNSLYWPGLGAKGAVLHKVEFGANSATAIRTVNLPKTPATMDGTWAGKITSTVVPNTDSSTFLTWTATITPVDTISFRLTFELRASTSNGVCKLQNDVNLLRTGG